VKIASISDLHIKSPEDESYGLLLSFLSHPEVRDSDCIILLGDIFDFMMGEHKEYLNTYEKFFCQLKNLLEQGKEIHFFEGNHDFHLEGLFKNHLKSNRFYYNKIGIYKIVGGKNIFFCHGDDIQIGDPSYKYLKFILRNRFSRFLFNKIFPFKLQQGVAEYFSNKSRKRGQVFYSNQEYIREIFRKSALKFWEKNPVDILLCGHSHCKDDFKSPEGNRYLNNGYPSESKCFLIIDEKNADFRQLS
jgi:UDP-2,3-diacylglucosamine hydrolase